MFFETKYNKNYSNMYILSHIIIGGILGVQCIPYTYRIVLLLSILIYQFVQLIFNFRYFFDKNILLKGNSIKHTINKLSAYLIGYFITWVI